MNLYSTLTKFKAELGESATANDALYMRYLKAASRWVDNEICMRHFFVDEATRFFDGPPGNRLILDDVLAISAFTTDSEDDQTFDGETWVEDTDYILWPGGLFPKLIAEVAPNGSFGFAQRTKYVKVVGTWGYGDGKSATPFESVSPTVSVATKTGTTITVTADNIIEPGHTVRAASEQMFVSAVTAGSFTAERGVNGTEAEIHATAAASVYLYPAMISRFTDHFAGGMVNARGRGGFLSEQMGNYRYQMALVQQSVEQDVRLIGGFRKPL